MNQKQIMEHLIAGGSVRSPDNYTYKFLGGDWWNATLGMHEPLFDNFAVIDDADFKNHGELIQWLSRGKMIKVDTFVYKIDGKWNFVHAEDGSLANINSLDYRECKKHGD